MQYQRFHNTKDLPEQGPALLSYSPFSDLKCGTLYWVPVLNCKFLCYRCRDVNTDEEVLMVSHVPYVDLAQRWLEEAIADPGPGRVFATAEEINSSFDRMAATREAMEAAL